MSINKEPSSQKTLQQCEVVLTNTFQTGTKVLKTSSWLAWQNPLPSNPLLDLFLIGKINDLTKDKEIWHLNPPKKKKEKEISMTGLVGASFLDRPFIVTHTHWPRLLWRLKAFPRRRRFSSSLLSLIWRPLSSSSSSSSPLLSFLKVGKNIILIKQGRWGRHPVASALPPKPLRFQRAITFASVVQSCRHLV